MMKKDWIEWGRATGIRAWKTVAEAALAGVVFLLISMKGLPKVRVNLSGILSMKIKKAHVSGLFGVRITGLEPARLPTGT